MVAVALLSVPEDSVNGVFVPHGSGRRQTHRRSGSPGYVAEGASWNRYMQPRQCFCRVLSSSSVGSLIVSR
jgi:hypothetical protein